MSLVHKGFLRSGGLLRNSLLGVCLGLLAVSAGCTPDKATDTQRALNATGAPYVHLYSGPYDATLGVRHYVGVRGLTTDQSAGILDLLTVPTEETPNPETIPLLQSPTAAWATLAISPAGTERMLFVDSVDVGRGAGTLKYVNLSDATPAVQNVDQGKFVRQQNIYFGANGDRMLFIANYNATTEAGELFFWDGTSGPKRIAEAVNTDVVLFSVDRTKALVVENYVASQKAGDLLLVDMSGAEAELTSIDKKVVIFASAFARDGYASEEFLSDRLNLAFSATRTLSAIAYTKLDMQGNPQLFRYPRDGNGQVFSKPDRATPAAGVFPGISESGKVIAYLEYRQANGPNTVASQFLHVWNVETGADLYEVRLKQLPAICPKVSPDDRFVTFLTDVHIAGQSGASPALGTLKMVPVKIPNATSNDDLIIELGLNVDWGSLRFGPTFTNQPTTSLSFIGKLHDLTGKATLAQAKGNIYGVQLQNGFPEAFTEPVALEVYPDLVYTLPNANGLAFEINTFVGNEEQWHPWIWVPGMKLARQLDRNERADHTYKRGSLKTSGVVPSLVTRPAVRPDEIGYIMLPKSADKGPVVAGVLRGLKVRTGGEVSVDLDTAADRQTYSDFFFSPIGRVLGFLAISGDAKNIQIWDLPFPDAQ